MLSCHPQACHHPQSRGTRMRLWWRWKSWPASDSAGMGACRSAAWCPTTLACFNASPAMRLARRKPPPTWLSPVSWPPLGNCACTIWVTRVAGPPPCPGTTGALRKGALQNWFPAVPTLKQKRMTCILGPLAIGPCFVWAPILQPSDWILPPGGKALIPLVIRACPSKKRDKRIPTNL